MSMNGMENPGLFANQPAMFGPDMYSMEQMMMQASMFHGQQQMMSMQLQQAHQHFDTEQQQQYSQQQNRKQQFIRDQELQRRQDFLEAAHARKASKMQTQEALRNYDEMWRQDRGAHYSVSKEGYAEAWSQLTAKLENEDYTLRENNPYKGSSSSCIWKSRFIIIYYNILFLFVSF